MSDIAIIGIIAAAFIVFRVALTAPEKTPQQRREEQELNREFGVSAPALILLVLFAGALYFLWVPVIAPALARLK